ncbi:MULTISPECIES: phenylacetate--CoA ligase family protein [unclassified Mycobacterium]|uniref:phenylacetate--CoA ligase family protein n=1 Tax=unclassified Mycobacterium TaxID=2642494 RepID=UPI0029C872AB|nr:MULTISPECIES: phenylacetate--CoA ligase family protein [unclassified Mycobacterium]
MEQSAYQRIRAAHLHAVQAALTDHVKRLDWSAQQIRQHRDERLRSVLAYARERSTFYADRLRGVDFEAVTASDLASIPMLTKAEAQSEWDAIVTTPDLNREAAELVLTEQTGFSYTPHDQQVFSSGGASGVRGVYVWDWQFFVTTACLAWRMQARAERRDDSAPPARLAVLTAGGPPHASTPLFDVPTVTGMDTAVIEAGAPFDEVLAAVQTYAPTHLVGYASVIGRLARASLAGDLRIRPHRVSTNSEPLLPEDRDAIIEAWHAPLHNLWGSTELGVQAVGCGYGSGLHICEDEVILERVDDAGAPVGPNEPAVRTLATGLSNRTFPFVRYDLGDEIALMSEPCVCGSAFARVADISGRRDDDFVYGSHTVPASAFRHVLGTDPRILEYQVQQTEHGVDVLAVADASVRDMVPALVQAMQRHGVAHPSIRIRSVQTLGRNSASGKLKRFVPLSS